MQQRVTDEAVAAAGGDQLVEADIQLAKLLDVEVFDGGAKQLLGAVAQQRQACAVDLEAGCQ
ncbi:hypothetical protein D3C81_1890410 [compost metagenome]